jgi:hypothetical protein
VQDVVNAEAPIQLVIAALVSAKSLISKRKMFDVEGHGTISSGGFLVHGKQLRDWKRLAGFPTSGLSERRDFNPKTRR